MQPGAQDGATFSLKFKHERGSPLEYTITVTWDHLDHGKIILIMIPDNSASTQKEWYMGSISSNSGIVTYKVLFPIDNPSPTTYTVYVPTIIQMYIFVIFIYQQSTMQFGLLNKGKKYEFKN